MYASGSGWYHINLVTSQYVVNIRRRIKTRKKKFWKYSRTYFIEFGFIHSKRRVTKSNLLKSLKKSSWKHAASCSSLYNLTRLGLNWLCIQNRLNSFRLPSLGEKHNIIMFPNSSFQFTFATPPLRGSSSILCKQNFKALKPHPTVVETANCRAKKEKRFYRVISSFLVVFIEYLILPSNAREISSRICRFHSLIMKLVVVFIEKNNNFARQYFESLYFEWERYLIIRVYGQKKSTHKKRSRFCYYTDLKVELSNIWSKYEESMLWMKKWKNEKLRKRILIKIKNQCFEQHRAI